MKIAVLSKADVHGGGASRIAHELTEGLRESGINAIHYVGWGGTRLLRDAYSKDVTPIWGKTRASRIIAKSATLAQLAAGIPELIPYEIPFLAMSQLMEADVVHVHDITELLSSRSLLWLSRRKRVAWTMHDYSPLTAGCLYPFDIEPLGCRRWLFDNQTGCDKECPLRRARGYPFGGIANGVRILWKMKYTLAKEGKFDLVTPSSWLADEISQSQFYRGYRPKVIFNGIAPPSGNKRLSKQKLRLIHGLPSSGHVAVMSACNFKDTNKGLVHGIKALSLLPQRIRSSLIVLCIGRPPAKNFDYPEGITFRWSGYIEDRAHLGSLISAADFMVYPSLADNQPLAVIESLACGTPVFAFETGGIPEIIGTGGGRVAKWKDSQQLADLITESIDNNSLGELGVLARDRAETHFSRARMTKEYMSLYEKMISRGDSPST